MMADALDIPCPICDAQVAQWCEDGPGWDRVHIDRAYPPEEYA